jgi:outer membrane protein OmpA-like peptidoglycan-associated protein
MFRSGVRTRIVVGLGAAAVGLLLGGCSGVPVEEYELAVAENSQLRERISALQDNLQRAETDKRVLQERRAELEGELSGVRSELMETRTQAAVLQANRGPAAEGFEARGNNQVATVAGDLLFASGSATIRKAGREKLDGLARTIQDRFAGRQIRVEGHTDSDPIRKSSSGDWRSWLAHQYDTLGVTGSSPVSPIPDSRRLRLAGLLSEVLSPIALGLPP